MLSAEHEQQVLCDQYLRRENGTALLILSKTLCTACNAGQTAGSVLSGVVLDMKGGGWRDPGLPDVPALSCAPDSPSAPLPKLSTCRYLETFVATWIGKESLEGGLHEYGLRRGTSSCVLCMQKDLHTLPICVYLFWWIASVLLFSQMVHIYRTASRQEICGTFRRGKWEREEK